MITGSPPQVIGEVATSLLVAVLTCLILWQLLRLRRNRKSLGAGSQQGQSARDRQLTVILVLVAAAFVVLRAPYTVSWYLSHYSALVPGVRSSPARKRTLGQTLNIVYCVYILNYAVNFFFYSLAGSRFRGILTARCGVRGQSGHPDQNSGMTSLSTVPDPDAGKMGTKDGKDPTPVTTGF